MDLAGASVLKNLDTSPDGRAWSKEMSGTFPIRIRAIYAFNAGLLVRALLSVAKWILPKKIMDRLTIVDKKNLFENVDANNLVEDFGGNRTFDHATEIAGLTTMFKEIQANRRAAPSSQSK